VAYESASARPADPLERTIEQALEPGLFVSYAASSSFVEDLEAVAAQIATLTPGAPARAVVLYETFLAGCYEKAEEIDDSGGSLGLFVEELFRGWIRARQAAGADPDETAARLLAWMEDDPYGFCAHLERDALKALDRSGRTAFEREVRVRFDAATAHAARSPRPGGDYVRRRWAEVLRAIYLHRKNTAAYIALADETGVTPEDCLALSGLLLARRKPEEALAWVDRGLALAGETPHGSMASHDLARRQREVLTKLGRGDEALEAAWAEYRKAPHPYAYADLMKQVPEAERAAWHERAMDAALTADLSSAMELFLETRELTRLAERLRQAGDEALEAVSHSVTEPAAKKLERPHPELAARLWRAQGMRILRAKKSRYYEAALRDFAAARRCYERAGQAGEWQRLVDQVRAEHRRKTGFVADFEALVAGAGPDNRPSFLERAKARWGRRT